MTDIEDLDDTEFHNLVQQELRREAPSTSPEEKERLTKVFAELQQPYLLLRWMTMLDSMKRSAERQLGARKADLLRQNGILDPERYRERRAYFLEWRAKTLRLLSHIENRLTTCRTLRNEHFPERYPYRLVTERNELSEQVMFLRGAIREHQATTTLDNDYHPSHADRALWLTVEEPPDL